MSTQPQPAPVKTSPEEAVQRVQRAGELLRREVHKVIIGQEQMIEEMLICLFARGHCLTIGVPGLAKTLTVSTLARALHLKFSRIQFTPDLMPSDITGTEIIEEDIATGKRAFRFVQGPVFANIVLADEINRTPPKTQAALLQAMQEYQVTAGSNTFDLDPPFFVMATQNPIEQEGTYPLPEAQLDRFMLSINIGYPSRDDERRIVNATTQAAGEEIRPILSGRDLLWIQQLVREIPASDHMVDYAVDLVRATRPKEPGCRASSRTGWPGAPDRGPPSTSFWPPRPAPSSTAAWPSAPATSAPSCDPCSAIASSPISMPTPREWAPIRSSTRSSRPCPSRRTVSPAVTEVPGSRLPRRPSRREPERQPGMLQSCDGRAFTFGLESVPRQPGFLIVL